MTHRLRQVSRQFSRWLVCGLTLAGLCSGPALAQAPRPAELMPLAERSLVLDLARAGERIVAVGERGHVLVSMDQGRSWRQVVAPVRANLTAVFFVDAEHGWAVGHDGAVIRTTDGGATWALTHHDPDADTPLLDVWFGDPDNGMAVGAFGLVLRTRDGGANWESGVLIEEDDFHLNQIGLDRAGVLWIAAEAGNLYRSADRGATWEAADSPYHGSLFGLLAQSEQSLLLYGLRGHLFRSTDGGDSWTEIPTGTPALLHGAVQLESGRSIVVGLDGTVLASDTAGENFRLLAQADRLGLTAAVAVDGALVVAGEGGVRRIELDQLGALP